MNETAHKLFRKIKADVATSMEKENKPFPDIRNPVLEKTI